MKKVDEQQKPAQNQEQAGKSRFQIEKLEERIAPAKGGIPGPPEGNGGGGRCNYHKGCR